MKKYKGLSRIYLLCYLIVIFCGVLFGFLLVKQNLALALVLLGLVALDFAALIVARCMFKKHYLAFFYISMAAIGFMNVTVLGSFIIELVYTVQGLPAPYAWMISIISILLTALSDAIYILTLKKIHRKRLIEEGVIEEDKEEEV